MARQLVGFPVEVLIGEGFSLEDNRHSLRPLAGLGLEELVDASAPGIFPLRLVPLDQDPMALLSREQQELRYGTVATGYRSLEQIAEGTTHLLNRLSPEKLLGVVEGAGKGVGRLFDFKTQVQTANRAATNWIRFQLNASRVGNLAVGYVAVVKHHLKQRPAADLPGRMQLLHKLLKRSFLPRVSLKRRLANALQQIHKAGIAGQTGAHHQHVHEAADETLRSLSVRPATGTPTRMSSCPVYRLSRS